MTHEEVIKSIECANPAVVWDFNTSNGDTIKEKWENLEKTVTSLFLLIKEIHDPEYDDNPPLADEYWVVVPKEYELLFIFNGNFEPSYDFNDSKEEVKHYATCGNYKIYVDSLLEDDLIVVGQLGGFNRAFVKCTNNELIRKE